MFIRALFSDRSRLPFDSVLRRPEFNLSQVSLEKKKGDKGSEREEKGNDKEKRRERTKEKLVKGLW